MSYLMINYSDTSQLCWPEPMLIAMYTIVYGGMAAAQANQWGPDFGKGIASALRVFQVMDRPTQINAIDDIPDAKKCDRESFAGQIEFRNVWFRYPTRLEEWVFRGLNLTIEPNDTIAIVGESGSGKSTFINLVMRFYDPEFG